MRSILVISLLLLLSGCGRPDQLHSEYPLLVRVEPVSLRDGVWLWTDDDGCPVDARQPARDWPDCAHWAVVRGDWISERNGPDDGERHGGDRFVFASGEPGLLQVRDDPGFSFEFVQVTGVDGVGQIVEARRWPVLCSDKSIGGKKVESVVIDDGTQASPPPPVPEEPLPEPSIPGAYRVDDVCYAADLQTLAAASNQAPRIDRFPANFRWIRDGRG